MANVDRAEDSILRRPFVGVERVVSRLQAMWPRTCITWILSTTMIGWRREKARRRRDGHVTVHGENMLGHSASGTHRVMDTASAALLARIIGEYEEMPGLNLSAAQARRLWHLDEGTCRRMLAVLVDRGYLTKTSRGTYVRRD